MKTKISDSENELTVLASSRPRVVERYSGYKPPFDVETLAEKMIATVPAKYLLGLREVVLTNFADDLPRRVRRSVTKSRKRKVRIAQTRGLYHPAWNNRAPWIELFVDRIFRSQKSSWWRKIRLLREFELGDVLFHEIGHHIHYTVRPEHREKEDVADDWKSKLFGNYVKAEHPIVFRLLRLALPLIRFYGRRAARSLYEKGHISHKEFQKSMK